MPNQGHQPRPALDSWGSIEGWSTATDRAQFEEDFNAEGCQAFANAHCEDFPFCEAYAEKLREFLHTWPLSRKNLEIAWVALDLGRITPIETPPEPKTIRINPVIAAQVSPASEEEAETLEKLKDVPYLHDSQRKTRDLKLRAAAIASRIAHRKHPSSALTG
jgi:hypothetical protein